MHEAITIGEFVGLLWEGLNLPQSLEMARVHGWAEPQDVRLAGEVLRRNDAARLIHEFLKCELGEADEENWNAAKSLADLYDCHACVRHVAQAFCKGIMTAKGQAFGIREGQVVGMSKGQAFGMREPVTYEEAREVAERVFHKNLRLVQCDRKDAALNAESLLRKLTCEEARQFLRDHPDAILVDVRTRGEFDASHPDGAVNIPLLKLLEAPQSLLDKGNVPILLTCDAGYRAEIAATKLFEMGHRYVSYYGFDA